MTIRDVGSFKNNQSEDWDHDNELFQEICQRLRATDETAQERVRQWRNKIRKDLKRDNARMQQKSPTLAKARKDIDIEIKRLEKIASPDDPPSFLYYGMATENMLDHSPERRQALEEEAARFDRRRNLERAAQQEIEDLKKQRENPSWELGGGQHTVRTMHDGTPESNFVTNVVEMYEDFLPGESTWTDGGNTFVVCKNLYQLLTGISLDETPDFSLGNQLRKAVQRFRNIKSES